MLIARVFAMPKTGAATSLVLEKFFDTTTLLLLLGLVSLLVELPAPLASVRRGLAAAAVLLLLAVVALTWRGTGLVRLLERQAHGDGGWVAQLARHGETIVASLRIIRQWHGFVLIQAGYLGSWLALAGVNYAVLRALEIGAPVAAAFFVLIVLQVGTSVPSTPGKIGIFQYLAVLALAPFGVARESALTYGVLLHVVGFGPVIALGGFWSWISSSRSRTGVVCGRSPERRLSAMGPWRERSWCYGHPPGCARECHVRRD